MIKHTSLLNIAARLFVLLIILGCEDKIQDEIQDEIADLSQDFGVLGEVISVFGNNLDFYANYEVIISNKIAQINSKIQPSGFSFVVPNDIILGRKEISITKESEIIFSSVFLIEDIDRAAGWFPLNNGNFIGSYCNEVSMEERDDNIFFILTGENCISTGYRYDVINQILYYGHWDPPVAPIAKFNHPLGEEFIVAEDTVKTIHISDNIMIFSHTIPNQIAVRDHRYKTAFEKGLGWVWLNNEDDKDYKRLEFYKINEREYHFPQLRN